MKKEFTIFAVVAVMIAAIGILYYYPTGDDVRIAKLDAPQYLELKESGELTVTLRNNALTPVNVSIDIENAFINENRTSSSYINSKSPYGKLTLLPGNNTEHFFLGYLVTGTHNVKVKVYQNGQVIDTSSINVTVLVPQRPELSLQLAYRKETTVDYDIYKIYGYIIDGKTIGSKHYDVPVQITIIDDETGNVISNDTKTCYVRPGGIATLSNWKGKPMAVIELAHNKPSNETYLPVQNVAKGMSGDIYRVKVTATWYDPWYSERYDQWYELNGRTYKKYGYWYNMSGKWYDPPQFDQMIMVNDELVIPQG